MDCGVSLAWLLDFADRNVPKDPTTEQVLEVVLAHTRIRACSYASMLPSQHVDKATFVVSHNSASKFSYLIQGVRHFLRDADPAKTFLWIDIFCVSMHAAPPTMHAHTLTHGLCVNPLLLHVHTPSSPLPLSSVQLKQVDISDATYKDLDKMERIIASATGES